MSSKQYKTIIFTHKHGATNMDKSFVFFLIFFVFTLNNLTQKILMD